jgi:APA family basic amino acid/polyamine antiporter
VAELTEGPNASEIHRGRRPGDIFLRRPRPRRLTLHRVLGVPGLFSAAYGNVGSSIYYALGITALYALGLTPVVFLVAGLFFGATALTYAEGTAAMPQAGGSMAFARRAFNPFVSFGVGWAQLLNYMVTVAISAFAVANYLAVFWEPLGEWPVNSIFGIGVVLFLTVINVIGVQESSRVNILLAVLDLLTQALLVVLGLVLVVSIGLLIDNVIHPQGVIENISLGTAPTWDRLILGIAISMIAFTGIETVSNLAEETKNPAKNVPRSMLSVFAAVLVMYTLIPVVALSAMPVFQKADGGFATELGDKYINDPVLGIVENLGVGFTTVLEVWVGLLAATILFIAANAGMLGMSRLAYSMGQNRDLPPAVSRLHPTRRTPATAIMVLGVLSALLIIPGKLEILAAAYVFGAMLSFTFAHASIIGLRVREPGMARPFRIPVNLRLRGRRIPVTAVLGGMATLFAWFVVVATQMWGWVIGFSWLGLGLLAYLGYRWYKRARPEAARPG